MITIHDCTNEEESSVLIVSSKAQNKKKAISNHPLPKSLRNFTGFTYTSQNVYRISRTDIVSMEEVFLQTALSWNVSQFLHAEFQSLYCWTMQFSGDINALVNEVLYMAYFTQWAVLKYLCAKRVWSNAIEQRKAKTNVAVAFYF